MRDESTKDKSEEVDFVKSVEENDIVGTKKREEKKELVIPLIVKNNWRQTASRSSNGEKESEKMEVEELTLEQKAAREIEREAAREMEDWESRDQDGKKKVDKVGGLIDR